MPTLSLFIPENHREDLARLLSLDAEQTAALIAVLNSIRSTSPSDFVGKAVIPNIETSIAARMFTVLSTLYTVRAQEGIDLASFVAALIDAMRSSGNAALLAAADSPEATGNQLHQLLETNFSVASKANELSREFPYALFGSRILTDIRPVFGDSVVDNPIGVIIAHTLKLEYHGYGAEHEALYVAVPEDELSNLREAITRALQKSETLQRRLRDAGLNYLSETERE